MSTHGQAPEPKAPVRHPEPGHVGLTLHDSSDVGYHKALTKAKKHRHPEQEHAAELSFD